MAESDACPHLDSVGEVTKEDLLQKSKVGFFISFVVNMFLGASHWLCASVCHSQHTPVGDVVQ